VIREGRHRYYRLANEQVAAVLEGLATLGDAQPARRPNPPPANPLRFARSCYDHLAGELGVSVASALQDRALLVPDDGKRFSVTPAGAQWFANKLRIEIDALKPARHGIACGCLDWTERRYHLAGPLGTAMLRRCFDLGFLRRGKEPRAVTLTVVGAKFLALELGLEFVSRSGSRQHDQRSTTAAVRR
jgi:hypothetical protein